MDSKRLFDLLQYGNPAQVDQPAFWYQYSGSWQGFSRSHLQDLADNVSCHLLEQGVTSGDHIGILTANGSPEWLAIQMGIWQIGAIVTPMHAGLTIAEYHYLERDADLKVVYHDAQLATIDWQCPTLHFNQEVPGRHVDEDLVEKDQIIKRREAVSPDQVALLIYTSGSSGQPKGVLLTHYNILSNVQSILSLLPLSYGERAISYLPVSHIFECTVIYTLMAGGIHIYFHSSVAEALEQIKTTRPHFFSTVPRILERVYEKLLESSEQAPWLYKKLFDWGLQQGGRYGSTTKNPIYRLQLLVIDLLIFSKWRRALGGRLKAVVVGAAAMNEKISRTFSATGIKIREGYGMTETSPVISCNRFTPGGNRFGTTGMPIPGVEVKIDSVNPDGTGDICVKSPGLMKGYWIDSSFVAAPLDQSGWFHTGDQGRWVDNHFLEVTGRTKSIYKTSSGKYIYPGTIEKSLNALGSIEQAIVIGFQKPYVIAIILPRFERLESYCAANKIHWTSPTYMVHNIKITQWFEKQIEEVNSELKSHEQVKKFVLVADEWSLQSGLLTPTYKIKRTKLEDKYSKEIQRLYAH